MFNRRVRQAQHARRRLRPCQSSGRDCSVAMFRSTNKHASRKVANFFLQKKSKSPPTANKVSKSITRELSFKTRILQIQIRASIDSCWCSLFQRLVFSERRETLATDRQPDYSMLRGSAHRGITARIQYASGACAPRHND